MRFASLCSRSLLGLCAVTSVARSQTAVPAGRDAMMVTEAWLSALHDQHLVILDETPSFFPDGNRIAFQSDRSGKMKVWVMNVDGTGAQMITR